MKKNRSTQIHIFLGKLIFFWGFMQIALIGLAHFGVTTTMYHAIGGVLLAVMALVMLITAITGKLGGRHIGLSVLLLLLVFPVQGFLVHAPVVPAVARALHPLFGISIMFLARYLSVQAAGKK
ncbi:MAG TPA: hypothetical protein PLC52_07345 [Anaerolineales bacterium]|nr:hypothetical protein [Anaerolineales bacterium]HRQ92665.1 hypothetical protein [Anaerolineales bacterium]